MSTQETNGTALAKVEGPGLSKATMTSVDSTRSFEPNGIQEAFYLAGILVKSKLLPDTVQTPEAAFAIIATGRELGLTAMQSLRSIHVIKGKATLSADLIASLVKTRRDVCAYFMLVESTDTVAKYETQRVGEPRSTVMSFTIDDAKRAQLTSNATWAKFPAAMLRARCITALARAVYPDLSMGLYDTDEFTEQAPVTRDPYEVIREPSTDVVVPDKDGMAACLAKIEAAVTIADVNAAAKYAVKASADGRLTHVQLEAIKTAVLARRSVLAKSATTGDV